MSYIAAFVCGIGFAVVVELICNHEDEEDGGIDDELEGND